jgi:hypothetical protein
MRKKEAIYMELQLDDVSLTDEAQIAAMVAHLKLIERHIVVNGSMAALGRPPESVLEILWAFGGTGCAHLEDTEQFRLLDVMRRAMIFMMVIAAERCSNVPRPLSCQC